ncbi:MAG: UDP-N-acetylmuramyl-tripeptide synthetase [Candidatus Dojkabacteria bacterium]|nr:MAG: UDP-N-acetylmuramyl-tripeptide synthetase [Candidatus Dojkabacteria bacterium]
MTQDHIIQKLKNRYHLLQSLIANLKHGFPARELKVIAVTGTDGKTTTTSMIYHVLKEAGLKVGYISTIEAKIADETLDTGLHVTTPDPWDVPYYLDKMRRKGITHVVLESTSSGLQQNRLFGIKFDAATITNIKTDHLDYHGTWENYAAAKYLVAKKLKEKGLLVLNGDDKKSAEWLKEKLIEDKLADKIQIQWFRKDMLSSLQEKVDGMSFTFKSVAYQLPVIGSYNQENALAAISICSRYVSEDKIVNALKTLPVPKGRMEVIQKEPYTIIIDFAHTGHALDQALKAVSNIKPLNSNLITVFGCAGRRDRSRRSMGEIAARYSDSIVITAEDPRDESLAEINSEIIKYAQKHSALLVTRFKDSEDYQQRKGNYIQDQKKSKSKILMYAFDQEAVNSRFDAIDFACTIAEKGDIVFITGKAHEQSLAFGNTEYPWSDHEAVARVIANHESK